MGHDTKERVTIDPDDAFERDKGHGVVNFCMKWPDSRGHSTVKLVDVKGVTSKKTYTVDDEGKFVPVLGFECRGLEPTACYTPSTGLSATGVGGKQFPDIDFSENGKEWYDYDECSGVPVGLSAIEWRFDRSSKAFSG